MLFVTNFRNHGFMQQVVQQQGQDFIGWELINTMILQKMTLKYLDKPKVNGSDMKKAGIIRYLLFNEKL